MRRRPSAGTGEAAGVEEVSGVGPVPPSRCVPGPLCHAMAVGDHFKVLNRGRTLGTAVKGGISPDELRDLMAGGQELAELESSLGGAV